MAETEQKIRYLKFSAEEGFDLSPIYIKDVAKAVGTSPSSVKREMIVLLKVLPIEDRVTVLENLERAKRERGMKKEKEKEKV